MLHEFGIASSNHRWEDGTQAKGYDRVNFTNAWARCCPTPRAQDPDTQTRGRPVAPTGSEGQGWGIRPFRPKVITAGQPRQQGTERELFGL